MTSIKTGLQPSDLEQYQRTGYVAVRGMFSPEEIAAWQRECDRLWSVVAALPQNGRIQHRGVVGGESTTTIADRIDPLLDLSPTFAALTGDERIIGPTSSALGSGAALLKEKLITKRPGTMGYAAHQDYPYWEWLGIPADELLTVLVAIDAADRENGALEVFPGMHRERIQPPPDNPLDTDETMLNPEAGEAIELDAGDILLFHSMVPHRSDANRSSRSRRALFLTYTTVRYPGAYQRYHAPKPGSGTT
jgi:2-aminoethylphosphonate dioxygenase